MTATGPPVNAPVGWRAFGPVFRGEYRRSAVALLVLLAGVTIAAWALTISLGMSPAMMAMMVTTGGVSGVAVFVGIWMTMMVAMMFPAAAPMAEAYVHLSAGRDVRRPWLTVRALGFLGVYVAVWTSVGLLFALGYLLLAPHVAEVSMSGTVGVPLAAATLLVAGVYQATPLKDACLNGCRSPFSFLATEWRDGVRGAVRLGARHAAYCVGCCALLFVVLLAVGLMAIGWMLLVTVIIFIEKLGTGASGRILSWAVGAGLATIGVAFVLLPSFGAWALGIG